MNSFLRSSGLIVGLLCGMALTAVAQEGPKRPQPWSPEVVRLFESIPIQDGGRIKPLDTYASVALLKFNGKRSCNDLSGKRISATEWLMDTLFYPEDSRQYKIFRVDNSDVMVDLSLSYTKRRDRYSYEDLAAAYGLLMERARAYSAVDERRRSLEQAQLINLAHNVMEYETILHAFDLLRLRLDLSASDVFASLSAGQPTPHLSGLLAKAPEFLAILQGLQRTDENQASFDAAMHVVQTLSKAVEDGQTLALIPPASPMIKSGCLPAGWWPWRSRAVPPTRGLWALSNRSKALRTPRAIPPFSPNEPVRCMACWQAWRNSVANTGPLALKWRTTKRSSPTTV